MNVEKIEIKEITETPEAKETAVKRSITTGNFLSKKAGKLVQVKDDILRKVIGDAEQKGCWLVYGREKNGKTWFSLQLAKELARQESVLYISAEEGLDKSFQDAALRAGITARDKILWEPYICVEQIREKLNKRRAANIVFIDNLTMYEDEIKKSELKRFIDEFPEKLIIFVAHEERQEAYPAIGRQAKKLAKVIFRVQAFKVEVTSRFGGGGTLKIDNEQSKLIWGENN
jgi:archaellum biogenesis ATPase FlaH